MTMGEDFHRANPDWYPLLKGHAKEMRNNPTDAEAYLWKNLKGRALGVQFRRQCVILDYIADFYCPEHHLVVEVDGKYHETPEQKAWDEERTRELGQQGYNILRFTNEQVLYDIDSVIKEIKNFIEI